MEITTKAQLKIAILEMEAEKIEQKKNLVIQLHHTVESIQPLNILKNSLQKITSAPTEVGGKVLNAALGIGAGVISKKLMVGPAANILVKIAGLAVELGVAGMVAKNGQTIKTSIAGLLKRILHKSGNHENNKMGPIRIN